MKDKVKYIISYILVIFLTLNSIVYGVEEIVSPIEEGFINNLRIIFYIIMGTLGVLFLLSMLIKVMTGQKVFKGKFLSNKFVRFVEVTLCITIIIFLISEFISTWNKFYSVPGIVLALFAFYQRASNKNRKIAYPSLIMSILVYGFMKIIG